MGISASILLTLVPIALGGRPAKTRTPKRPNLRRSALSWAHFDQLRRSV